ncbi:hypothetical protein Dimus_013118, partial [Dionaea muscipula]
VTHGGDLGGAAKLGGRRSGLIRLKIRTRSRGCGRLWLQWCTRSRRWVNSTATAVGEIGVGRARAGEFNIVDDDEEGGWRL